MSSFKDLESCSSFLKKSLKDHPDVDDKIDFVFNHIEDSGIKYPEHFESHKGSSDDEELSDNESSDDDGNNSESSDEEDPEHWERLRGFFIQQIEEYFPEDISKPFKKLIEGGINRNVEDEDIDLEIKMMTFTGRQGEGDNNLLKALIKCRENNK